MASTSERILIDVDLNLKKSERSIDQFVAKARTAVQQANLSNIPAGQAVKPAGPAALGIQTAQTVATVRQQGVAQGLDAAQIRQATRLAQQQGREELDRYIQEKGLTGKGAVEARTRYGKNFEQTRDAYRQQELAAQQESAKASQEAAAAARRKAATEQKAAC